MNKDKTCIYEIILNNEQNKCKLTGDVCDKDYCKDGIEVKDG